MTCHAFAALVAVALALATLALLPPSSETLVGLIGVALELSRAVAVAVWRRAIADSYGVSLALIVAVTLYIDAGARQPTLYAMLLASSVALAARFVRFCEGPRLLWRRWHPIDTGDPPAAHSRHAVIIDD